MLLRRITVSNTTECFPSPKVPLVSTRNLVVQDSHVFVKHLMEKGGIVSGEQLTTKYQVLLGIIFFQSKGNYCYDIQLLFFSRFSQVENEQFTITEGGRGSI